MDDLEIDEFYGSNHYNKYNIQGDKLVSIQNKSYLFKLLNKILMIFLPQGYPQSVSKDYLKYQLWDSLQAYVSTISGSLAMQSVLQGSGVGNENATVVAATITWILKDGTGMIGRILFAWWKSNSLDANCKKWRLFADILNDVAIFIDIFASMFIDYFRFLSCFAAFSRALVGVAGGATRSSITQHQALRHNNADVSAKDGSQETLVNLFGLISSLVILPLFSNHSYVLPFLILLTLVHLYANYKAVGALQFDTLNRDRFHIVVTQFLQSTTIPSIVEANREEKLILSRYQRLSIKFGCSFAYLVKRISVYKEISIKQMLDIYKNKNYVLYIDSKTDTALILFSTNASSCDHIMAYYHFKVIEYFITQKQSSSNPVKDAYIKKNSVSLLLGTLSFVEKTMPSFIDLLQQSKWRTDVAWLSVDEWSIQPHSKQS